MMGFSFIEHRSDIIVLAKNKSFETAIVDLAAGMFTQMGADDAEEVSSFEIGLKAPTIEQLVVQLLTEVIAECETRPLTPKRMEVLIFNHQLMEIKVRIHGESKIPENIIKAVTYHGLRVEKKNGDWEIEVLFDI